MGKPGSSVVLGNSGYGESLGYIVVRVSRGEHANIDWRGVSFVLVKRMN